MSLRSACTRATTSASFVLLHNLRDIGNTVLVVEHDEDMMRAADHILDIRTRLRVNSAGASFMKAILRDC